jgi:hypothetical protein
MSSDLKVMVMGHGEKPAHKHRLPYGVTPDWDTLTVRGSQRAGALLELFAPRENVSNRYLATSSVIFASKPREDRSAEADDEGSKNKRAIQTITPLVSKLKLSPNLTFTKSDQAAPPQDISAQAGVVLISWQHEGTPDIALHLVKSNPPERVVPSPRPGDRFDLVWYSRRPTLPASVGASWKFRKWCWPQIRPQFSLEVLN